jgi:hypothetical protein
MEDNRGRATTLASTLIVCWGRSCWYRADAKVARRGCLSFGRLEGRGLAASETRGSAQARTTRCVEMYSGNSIQWWSLQINNNPLVS